MSEEKDSTSFDTTTRLEFSAGINDSIPFVKWDHGTGATVRRTVRDEDGTERTFVYREHKTRCFSTAIGAFLTSLALQASPLLKRGPRPLSVFNRMAIFPVTAWAFNQAHRGTPEFQHKYWLERICQYSAFAAVGIAWVGSNELIGVLKRTQRFASVSANLGRAWPRAGPVFLEIAELAVWIPTFHVISECVYPHLIEAEMKAKVRLYGVPEDETYH